MLKRRIVSIVVVVVAFGVAIFLLIDNDAPVWLVVFMGLVGIALVALNGRRGRHTAWGDAQEWMGPGHAVVFWKPGCMYCERLLRAVGDDDRVTWVNVHVDQEANDEVCRLNNGDELTPTALVADRVMRNPSAEELLASLRS